MRINRLHAPVTALGPGPRVGVWVQGCTLACAGCASRDTWDAAAGQEIEPSALAAAVLDIGAGCDGLTISGGEPLQQADELARMLLAVRAAPGASEWDVLLFTGLEPDEWDGGQRAAAALADAVVAGRYRAGTPGTGHPLLASGNQRLLLQTERGRERHALMDSGPPQIQAMFDDHGLTMIGLPRPGDLGRMERELRRRGVVLGGVSWRS